jgi:FAD/FMN-containing dehydrogenase
VIARGAGRSYGDSSLNPDGVVATDRLAHILELDESSGEIVCEAGVLLSDIIEVTLPRGWFPPVTPGTRFVTVGGMIASDVHGKNHHLSGSFADHVLWLDLALPDGSVLRCSREQNAELFAATMGGMGLTGVVLRCGFRLMAVGSAWIRQTTIRTHDLESTFDAFERAASATYSVGWIDTLTGGSHLGRSVVSLGEHARADELDAGRGADPLRPPGKRPLAVPFDFPSFALSPPSVRVFNELIYWGTTPGEAIRDLYAYFYPLDSLLHWNRIYGRSGFVQYQCVLPLDESLQGMRRLLDVIARAGGGSFLAVLKRMGPESFGLLSFPMEGYTLALDFPASPHNLRLLDRLDAITAEHRGRIYLAKDARAAAAAIEAGYPRLAQFRDIRRRYGLTGKLESLQSRRLDL